MLPSYAKSTKTEAFHPSYYFYLVRHAEIISLTNRDKQDNILYNWKISCEHDQISPTLRRLKKVYRKQNEIENKNQCKYIQRYINLYLCVTNLVTEYYRLIHSNISINCHMVHGVKVLLYFLFSPVFQAHILYFRGNEKIPIFCVNSPVFPVF